MTSAAFIAGGVIGVQLALIGLRAGVCNTLVALLELGRNSMSCKTALALSTALQEPPEWLLVPLLQSWLDEAGAGLMVEVRRA